MPTQPKSEALAAPSRLSNWQLRLLVGIGFSSGFLLDRHRRPQVLFACLNLQHPTEVAVRRPAEVPVLGIDGNLYSIGQHGFSRHIPLIADADAGGIMAADTTFRSHH